MKRIVIDFESYYDNKLSVKTLGNVNYAAKTDAYLVSAFGEGVNVCGSPMDPHIRETIHNVVTDSAVEPWAANSNFDQTLQEEVYKEKSVNPWKCVLDLGAFHQLPRNLAGLAQQALGVKVDKGIRDAMEGVRFESLPLERQKEVTEYCRTDSVREYQLIQKLPPMSPIEEEIAAHTRMVNRRGVPINTELVEHDKTALEEMRFLAFNDIPWHNDAKPLSYLALKEYCLPRGIPVPRSTAKTDDECDDMVTRSPELAAVIGAMRRFRKANTMIRKVESLMLRIAERDGYDYLPLDLMYCGAPHTRRWSSRGFNVQNLDKVPLVIREGLSVWTRNWLIPPPGKCFLILDYSQIEPRVLHWLAGDEEMLAWCRKGFSVYEAAARACKLWTGSEPLKHANLTLYTRVKAQELGLGFGMGAGTYGENNPQSQNPQKEVLEWRARNPRITAFWGQMDALIRKAALDGDKSLQLQMPSGDYLKHFYIQGHRGKHGTAYKSYTTKGDFGGQSLQPRLWGGTLTENVVQRIARDILADAVVRLEKADIPVYFHSHDEAIMAVDRDEPTRLAARAEAERIMQTPPAWAEGLPLAVDGGFMDCYGKL